MKTLIVGVGGAGINLLKAMQQALDKKMLAVNTDAASLAKSGFANTLLIGKDICDGQSTDGIVELGKLAAETALTELKNAMESYQQLAVVAGFGGGTGTGAAPVIAELGHSLGLRVTLVAVLPFAFETTRFDLTQSVLKALEGSPFRILTFKNDDAITDDQPLSMKEALALMNKQVASGLGVALQLTTEMRAAVPSQSSSKPVMPPIRYNQTEKMTLRFNFCKTPINNLDALGYGLPNSLTLRQPCILESFYISPGIKQYGNGEEVLSWQFDIYATCREKYGISRLNLVDFVDDAEQCELMRHRIEAFIKNQNIVLVESDYFESIDGSDGIPTLYSPKITAFAKEGVTTEDPYPFGTYNKEFDPSLEPRRLERLANIFLKNNYAHGSVILRSDTTNDAFATRWFLSKESHDVLTKSGFKQKLNEQLLLFRDHRQQTNHLLSRNAQVLIMGKHLSIRWIPDDIVPLLEDMAAKEKHRQIVLDTETTGLDPNRDRIIEIGCVELIDGKPSGREHHWYLNPEQQISEAAFSVHGISNETLADEPTFAEIIDDLLGFIREAELVIHNASFDIGFLNAELARSGHSKRFDTRHNVTDTLALARRLHPGQKNDLDSLCQRYGVDNSQRDLHGALLDAELLADVYQELLITDAKKQ